MKPDDEPETATTPDDDKREGSDDPDVRNGGPFGGDEDESNAWIKAFENTLGGES